MAPQFPLNMVKKDTQMMKSMQSVATRNITFAKIDFTPWFFTLFICYTLKEKFEVYEEAIK